MVFVIRKQEISTPIMKADGCSIVEAWTEKICARCFSRRFFHMQGTIREWTEEKLEGGSSQILETSDLRAVISLQGV